MAQLPVLVVIIPLLAAPLLVLVRQRALVRLMALAASAASAVCATLLALQVDDAISYHVGGWPPPVGIEYRVTKATAFVLTLVTSLGTVALFLGTRGTRKDVQEGRTHLFYAAYLLCLTGLLGMVVTGDAFNVFVFLEISSLSTYALVAMGPRRRALTAAFNYLILGTIGGTFVLIGIGLLYQMTGTLNGIDIVEKMADVGETRTVQVAFAFLVVGFGIKLAVFPLHQWLPNAYVESPSAVSSFLAGTATKVIYFQMIRVLLGVFGASYVFGTLQFGLLLGPLSLIGMFAGSLAAIYQNSLKRLLAYSSIGQVGYLTLALAFGTEEGTYAGMLHLGAHAVTKTGLFLLASAIIAHVGTDRIASLAGLGKRMPLAAFAFVVGGVGLIGVPGTAGFVSKWALLRAALEAGHLAYAIAILLSSLLAVVYVWRVVEVMYFREPPDEGSESLKGLRGYDWGAFAPALVVLGASIVLGVWSEPITSYLHDAAVQLYQGSR
ncbi:MAG: monovalent cation/H+ antiporter subunit D family protein [Myxococcota bacterium]